MLHFRRFQNSFHSFGEDEERNEKEEESVHKSGQYFSSHVAVAKFVIRSPFSYHLKYIFTNLCYISTVIWNIFENLQTQQAQQVSRCSQRTCGRSLR